MLPDFLLSSYKNYKTDTTKIACWLAENAGKCGWTSPNDIAPTGDTTKDAKAPRLKGRARKLARDAAAAEKKHQTSVKNSDTELPKHIIRIRDFVPMAACIAQNGSSIRITNGFLNLIKRCIMARSSTTDWYASKADSDDLDAKDSVEKHSHFTSILENVFRTLMTRFSVTRAGDEASKVPKLPSVSQQADDNAKTVTLANLFELLDVEDTNDDVGKVDGLSADAPITKGSESSPEPLKARYEIEHDDDYAVEEWFFALQLFFYDLKCLKLVLEGLWERYRDGEIDLTVPAVATNTAFDLVRRAESDFLREMPIPKGYAHWSNGADLCYLNYIDISVKKGFGPNDTEGPEKSFDYRRWNDVGHCLLVPYLCLKQFSIEVKERDGRIPMMSLEQERRLVTRPRSELKPPEQRDEDTTILMSSVSVIASFTTVSNAPSEDEFSAGIYELVKKQRFPLWLVFAAQSYLDVHHILRADVGRGLRDLQTAGRAAKSTLEEHFRFMKINKCELRDRKDETTCREIMKNIEEWGCDTQEARYLNKYATRKSGVRWDDNCVVKKHPLLAGLLKFSIHLVMQEEGILLVNSVTTVLSIAHLYNAVEVEGYLPKEKRWKDLDFVLNVHSSQDIFVGGRPTNPEDYAKRMSLAQGISPETFATNRRDLGPKFSKKGSRELNSVCPVAGAFRERYCSGGSVDLSIQVAEDLINQLAFKEQNSTNGLSKTSLRLWKSRGLRLRLEDFVDYLAEALQLEAPQYQFDYFALHRRTWTMLKEIKEKIRPVASRTFTETMKKKYESDSGVVMVPSIVIAMACDITKSMNLFHIKRSLQVDFEPLKITAAELEKLIDEEGDVEMKRLREVCHGFAGFERIEKGGQPDNEQTLHEGGQAIKRDDEILDEVTDSLDETEIPPTFEMQVSDAKTDLDRSGHDALDDPHDEHQDALAQITKQLPEAGSPASRWMNHMQKSNGNLYNTADKGCGTRFSCLGKPILVGKHIMTSNPSANVEVGMLVMVRVLHPLGKGLRSASRITAVGFGRPRSSFFAVPPGSSQQRRSSAQVLGHCLVPCCLAAAQQNRTSPYNDIFLFSVVILPEGLAVVSFDDASLGLVSQSEDPTRYEFPTKQYILSSESLVLSRNLARFILRIILDTLLRYSCIFELCRIISAPDLLRSHKLFERVLTMAPRGAGINFTTILTEI